MRNSLLTCYAGLLPCTKTKADGKQCTAIPALFFSQDNEIGRLKKKMELKTMHTTGYQDLFPKITVLLPLMIIISPNSSSLKEKMSCFSPQLAISNVNAVIFLKDCCCLARFCLPQLHGIKGLSNSAVSYSPNILAGTQCNPISLGDITSLRLSVITCSFQTL